MTMASDAAPAKSPFLAHLARIRDIKTESPGVTTYELALEERELAAHYRFKPGQFNMLYLPGFGESAISISSDPARHDSLLHTVRIAGNVTRALARKKPGDQIGLRGPFGTSWPMKACRGHDVGSLDVAEWGEARADRAVPNPVAPQLADEYGAGPAVALPAPLLDRGDVPAAQDVQQYLVRGGDHWIRPAVDQTRGRPGRCSEPHTHAVPAALSTEPRATGAGAPKEPTQIMTALGSAGECSRPLPGPFETSDRWPCAFAACQGTPYFQPRAR